MTKQEAIEFVNENQCMIVFPWGTAPDEFKSLSDNGGDEDWVVVLSSTCKQPYFCTPPWLEAVDTCRDPQTIDLGDCVVLIGSHA